MKTIQDMRRDNCTLIEIKAELAKRIMIDVSDFAFNHTNTVRVKFTDKSILYARFIKGVSVPTLEVATKQSREMPLDHGAWTDNHTRIVEARVDAGLFAVEHRSTFAVPVIPTSNVFCMVNLEEIGKDPYSFLYEVNIKVPGLDRSKETDLSGPWITDTIIQFPFSIKDLRMIVLNHFMENWDNEEHYYRECNSIFHVGSPREISEPNWGNLEDVWLIAHKGICLNCTDTIAEYNAAVPNISPLD